MTIQNVTYKIAALQQGKWNVVYLFLVRKGLWVKYGALWDLKFLFSIFILF